MIKAEAGGTDPDLGLRRGADDRVSGYRNRIRTVILGIRQIRGPDCPDLVIRCTAKTNGPRPCRHMMVVFTGGKVRGVSESSLSGLGESVRLAAEAGDATAVRDRYVEPALASDQVLGSEHQDTLAAGDQLRSSTQRSGELERTTTIVLAEFAGLRGEIATRINILVTLMIANLTILGVILGIALTPNGNTKVLLLIPLVAPCLGLLIIDTFRNLDYLSEYICAVIRPQLQITSQAEFKGMSVFNWEKWVTKHQYTRVHAIPFQFVLVVEFLAPPIVTLIYAIIHFQSPQVQLSAMQWGLWWTGAVLTGVLMIFAFVYAVFSLSNPDGSMNVRLRGSNPPRDPESVCG